MASTKTTTSACLSLAALLALLQLCAAAQFTVGDNSGWSLGVNYTQWAAGKTFRVGDTLLFPFAQGAHTVLQVSQANYDSCTTANPIFTNSTANAVVALSSAGQRWYICGIPGHCSGGMKLAINVLASTSAGSAPPPATGSAAPPPAPATGSAAPPPPPATQADSPAAQIPPPTLPQGPQTPPASGAEKMGAAMGSAALVVAGVMLLV